MTFFSDLWVYEGIEHTWNVTWKIYTHSHAHHSYYSSEALTCLLQLCFAWAPSTFIHSVLWATNWITDLPCLLFLDLNDIPGNFSNCHDLICTSSFACWDVDGGSGGTTAFQKGSTLRSTFIQDWWNNCCSLGFFSLYPPTPCQKPSQLIYHPLSLST